jgi:hypothetical protein
MSLLAELRLNIYECLDGLALRKLRDTSSAIRAECSPIYYREAWFAVDIPRNPHLPYIPKEVYTFTPEEFHIGYKGRKPYRFAPPPDLSLGKYVTKLWFVHLEHMRLARALGNGEPPNQFRDLSLSIPSIDAISKPVSNELTRLLDCFPNLKLIFNSPDLLRWPHSDEMYGRIGGRWTAISTARAKE